MKVFGIRLFLNSPASSFNKLAIYNAVISPGSTSVFVTLGEFSNNPPGVQHFSSAWQNGNTFEQV